MSLNSRSVLLALSLLLSVQAFAQGSPIIRPKQVHDTTKYVHTYATSGTGTTADPWTGTGGVSPLQAAYNTCTGPGVSKGGCDLVMVPGVYDCGTTPCLTISEDANFISGITVRGQSHGNRAVSGHAAVNYDGAVLLYQGTGAAFKVGHFVSGSSSFWADGVTFRGFKLRQTGTLGWGIGFLGRLVRFSRFEDLTINDFSTGIALGSVSDFNIIDNVRIRDSAFTGIDLGRTTDDTSVTQETGATGETGVALGTPNGQCNSNRITNSDISLSARDSGKTAYAVYIHRNAVGTIITNNDFHNYDTTSYGAILATTDTLDVTSTVIDNNYFEGNYYAVRYNNSSSDETTFSMVGFAFTNNYVTQMEEYGIWVNSGADATTRGVVITGNSFIQPLDSSPYDDTKAVQLGTYVTNTTVANNVFKTLSPYALAMAGTGQEVVHGELGEMSEEVIHLGSMRITNITGGNKNLVVGGTLAVTGASTLTGAVGAPAGVTGNLIGNVTGNVTGDLAGSVTAGASKSVIVTAGTFRGPNSTTLPATCTVGDEYFDTDAIAGQNSYGCTATNTWSLQGDGGGTVAFSAVGGGTNASAAMIVGTGSSMTTSGSGTIVATTVSTNPIGNDTTGTASNVTGIVDTSHGGTALNVIAQGDLIYGSSSIAYARLPRDTNAMRVLCNSGTGNNPSWCQLDLDTGVTNTLPVANGGTNLTSGTSGGVLYYSASGTLASSGALASDGIVTGGGAGATPVTSAATLSDAGSLAIPTAQTVDVAAHATTGGQISIKEGADDGVESVKLKVLDAGLTSGGADTGGGFSGTTCSFHTSGRIPDACVGDGTDDGATGGDVTTVGPGCATLACWTQGVATAGTLMWVWEGTTDNAAEYFLTVPADPSADIEHIVPDAVAVITYPSGTDTLTGKATTDTFTNKTINVESTGNVVTVTEKAWLPAAGCNNATAASFWDLPASNAAVPTCFTGTVVKSGYLSFPAADGVYSAQNSLYLPVGFTSTVDAVIRWRTTATSGDIEWNLATICVGDSDPADPAAFNTVSQVVAAADATGSDHNDSAITTVDITGCAASEVMYLRISRDRTDAQDTLTDTESVILLGVELTLRRAM